MSDPSFKIRFVDRFSSQQTVLDGEKQRGKIMFPTNSLLIAKAEANVPKSNSQKKNHLNGLTSSKRLVQMHYIHCKLRSKI